MPGGRPTVYNDEMLAKASNYLGTCVDSYDEATRTWDVELPSIEGLSLYLDVSRPTIYEWKAKYSEFSDILDKILAEQAKRLLTRGLGGKYNPAIAKLALGKHGYHDKVDSDVTTAGEKLNVEMTPAMIAAQAAAAKVYEEKLKESLLE